MKGIQIFARRSHSPPVQSESADCFLFSGENALLISVKVFIQIGLNMIRILWNNICDVIFEAGMFLLLNLFPDGG